MMKKYNFSEIKRCTKNNTYKGEEFLIGKYFCQVFNETGEYVTYLIGETYKEVVDKQKDLLEKCGEIICIK